MIDKNRYFMVSAQQFQIKKEKEIFKMRHEKCKGVELIFEFKINFKIVYQSKNVFKNW